MHYIQCHFFRSHIRWVHRPGSFTCDCRNTVVKRVPKTTLTWRRKLYRFCGRPFDHESGTLPLSYPRCYKRDLYLVLAAAVLTENWPCSDVHIVASRAMLRYFPAMRVALAHVQCCCVLVSPSQHLYFVFLFFIIFFFFHKNCNKHFTIAQTKKIHSGKGRKFTKTRKKKKKEEKRRKKRSTTVDSTCFSILKDHA